MAEYYAVLKKAVGGPGAGSAEARRAVYDKARNALIGQLKAIDPPLAASEISRQRLELEEAIRRVERETTTEAQGARQPPANREPEPSIVPDPPPPPSAPQTPSQSSPQDIFRRAIQEAEARGTAAGQPPERAPAPVVEQRDGGEAPRLAAGDWPQSGRPEYQAEPRPAAAAARPVPDYDNEWQSREGAPGQQREVYSDQSEQPRRAARKRPEYFNEDEAEELEEPRRRSLLPTILLFVLIVGMLGGLVALGWSQRAVIADLIAGFDGGSTEVAAPVAAPAPTDQAPSKSEDRLAAGVDDGSAVRAVGPTDAGAIPPAAGADPIANAISGAPSAGSDGSIRQVAMLYEEPLDAAVAAAGVTAIDASIVWRLVDSGTSGAEIQATIQVPERGMNIRLVIRRNTDPTLPASHLVETLIETPADFPGKGIRSVPRLVLKAGEDERGEPLIGAAAKVAEGFFWIALSAAEADVQRNLQLLSERSWIDLPLVYETGQRAILTFEKGVPGDQVFEQAFAAWSTG